MRWPIALALLPLFATGVHAADLKSTSKIESVTVYPQSAEVTRIGKVKMERGEHVVLFNDLPANTVSGSIRVEGKATGRLEIGSVDTRRVKVPSTDEAVAATERKRIEDAIEKLRDERAQLSAAVEAAEVQKTLINNLAQLPTKAAPANGAAQAQPDWMQLYSMIGQRVAEAQKIILDTQIKIRATDLQIRDLEGKLVQVAPTQQERTEVKVFVNAGGPLEADIVIRYQVTSASWTPFYDARLATGTKTQAPALQLVRRASVQQRSGEIWDNVALSLSTARPGAGTTAPQLGPLTVDYEGEAIVRRELAPTATTRSVGAARVATIEDGDRRDKAAPESVAAEETRASVDAQAFQAVYGIPGRVTVPATGEAKRVQIDEMPLDPALTVRVVPKRDEKAFLYAKMTIARGTPILPGPVSLFRDATFVGSGRLPLLAPGEEHELGFGVADAVKVKHAIAEEKRSESGIITSSKTDTRNYRITAKNLFERAVNLVVLDQVPVSQNADIKVELIGKTAPTKQNVDDKRGVVAWEMKLEPNEEKVIEHGYRVTWPSAKKVIYGN